MAPAAPPGPQSEQPAAERAQDSAVSDPAAAARAGPGDLPAAASAAVTAPRSHRLARAFAATVTLLIAGWGAVTGTLAWLEQREISLRVAPDFYSAAAGEQPIHLSIANPSRRGDDLRRRGPVGRRARRQARVGHARHAR